MTRFWHRLLTPSRRAPARRPALQLGALEDRLAPAASLVADINPGQSPDSYSSYPNDFTTFDGSTYFFATDSNFNTDLWRTDGTSAETTKVLTPDSGAGSLTAAGSTLYFTTGVGAIQRLWASDGTATGSYEVKELPRIVGMTSVGNTLYFDGDDGVHGLELWKSDGTPAGTTMVKDINPKKRASSVPFLFEVISGTVLFFADDGKHGQELWKTDGTAAGTTMVKDINPGSGGAQANQVCVMNGTLYFVANDGTHGAELWKSDGTAAGTVLAAEVITGGGDGHISDLTVAGNTLYFAASDGTHGNELWKSDGTAAGTMMVADAVPGTGGSYPTYLTAFGGRVVYAATDSAHGTELWASDGTATGTGLLRDIQPGVFGSDPIHLTPTADGVFFATSYNNGDLWVTDGTVAGTRVVTNVNPGGVANLGGLTAFPGGLIFSASDATHGQEPWVSDGTTAGTQMLANLDDHSYPTGSKPSHLTVLGGAAYFVADDGAHGPELWRTDGTSAGTGLLTDINPGPNGSSPSSLTVVGGNLYFTADDGTHGVGLWKTDGTAAGTVPVVDTATVTAPTNFVVLNNTLYFMSNGGLWKTDGTAASTLRIATGGANLTAANGLLFFEVGDGQGHYALWSSDGTAAGTQELALMPGVFFGAPTLTATTNLVYYTDANFQGLYRSDGTAAGTFQISDQSGDLAAAVGDTLFFAGSDANGTELWKTDGTAAGTVMVKDIVPGAGSSFPEYLTNEAGTLYFSVSGGAEWKSDGTAAGTVEATELDSATGERFVEFLAPDSPTLFRGSDLAHGEELWLAGSAGSPPTLDADINPGSASSYPYDGALLNGSHVFVADDGAHGIELWTTTPSVTVTPAPGQADPAGGSTVQFTVTFTEPVSGFDSSKVDLSASTVGGTLQAAVNQLTPTTYEVDVTGMAGNGDVVLRVPAGVVADAAGHPNTASASGDDTIAFAPAGVIGLGQSTYATVEGVSPPIVVHRVGGSAGTVSVDYSLQDGTAHAGSDYAAVSGTVTWADGDVTDKMISVPITDDMISEGAETFTVALSNLTGTDAMPAAGTSSATVTIAPSDPIPLKPLPFAAQFPDADGDTVTVTLTGPGTADIYLTDGHGPIDQIVLSGTNSIKSSLGIKVTSAKAGGTDGVVNVRSIEAAAGQGGLKSLTAPQANILGDVTLAAGLGSLAVRDVGPGAAITLGAGLGKTITAADVGNNVTISTTGAISKLKAARFGTGTILADSIGSLQVTGDPKRGIPGDFAANIQLTGFGVRVGKPTLGSVKVAGMVTGSGFEVVGNVGAVKVGAFVDSSLKLTPLSFPSPFPATLASFTATGLADNKAQTAFEDSTIAGGVLGKIALASVGTAHPDQTFGVTATTSLTGLTVTDPAFKYSSTLLSPQGLNLDQDPALEFVIRVG